MPPPRYHPVISEKDTKDEDRKPSPDELIEYFRRKRLSRLRPTYQPEVIDSVQCGGRKGADIAASILKRATLLRTAGHKDRAVQLCKEFSARYYSYEKRHVENDIFIRPLELDRFHYSKANNLSG